MIILRVVFSAEEKGNNEQTAIIREVLYARARVSMRVSPTINPLRIYASAADAPANSPTANQ